MTEHIYRVRMIVGHFAMWAIRQSPCPVPSNLGKVLLALDKVIRQTFESEIESDNTFIFKTLESKIIKLLDDFVNSNEYVMNWNDPNNGDSGDGHFNLDALKGNLFTSLHQEIENDDNFDKEFDEEWEREQNK